MNAVFFALLLSSVVWSVFTLGVWGRHIGESAARFRMPWQPDGRAFAIWWPLYLTTAFVAVYGMPARVPIDKAALLLWSGTWVLTGVWVLCFDNQRNLVLAAFVLLGAFGTSLGALFVQRAWSSQNVEEILVFAPLSLLSGWLLVASSVGVGSALTCSRPEFGEVAANREVDLRLYEDATRDALFARRKEATTVQVVVVVVLALLGGCLAFAVPDPVFVLPLLWAVVNQRGFPRSLLLWLAFAILVAGGVVAAVRIFVWEF